MDFQKVGLFSVHCTIFNENRTIPIYYHDIIGKLQGRKYLGYEQCDDCTLTHNAFDYDECCSIYVSKIKNSF